MKIGFINNAYYPTRFGGAEISVQLLVEFVVRRGHEAVVLTITPTPGKRTEGDVNGAHIVYLPHKNLYSPPPAPRNPMTRAAWHLVDSYNPWMGREVSRWLEREKPAVVHTNVLGGFSVSAWDAVKKFGAPLVHTLREYYLQCRLMSLNRNGRECVGICAFCRVCAIPRRAASTKPDAVVGISRYVLDSHLTTGFFREVPIREVIYNPVGFKAALRSPKTKSSRLRLGVFGRIERLKGIDFLLREFQKLPKDKFELFVGGAGDTDYTQEIKSNNSGQSIHWLGFIKPPEFFEKIDILVVPSLWQEPFGRVIVEAYCHGIPVLASRKGGMTEIVDENITGLLFDPTVPGDFWEKLKGLTPESCAAMSDACREKSRDFEPDRIGEQYLELFDRVYRR